MRRRLVSIGIVFGVVLALLPAVASAASAAGGASVRACKAKAPGSAPSPGVIARIPHWWPSVRSAGCSACRSTTRWPAGAKIQIAVSRVLHTSSDAAYQGIMLVNPGGPGGSGLIYSVLGAFVPRPRRGPPTTGSVSIHAGVGASVPALSCDPNYFAGPRPPYEPATLRIEGAWLVKAATYAFDCVCSGLLSWAT